MQVPFGPTNRGALSGLRKRRLFHRLIHMLIHRAVFRNVAHDVVHLAEETSVDDALLAAEITGADQFSENALQFFAFRSKGARRRKSRSEEW